MHDRQPVPSSAAPAAAVTPAAPDALRQWAANVGNARFTRALGTPRAVHPSPVDDRPLQRALAAAAGTRALAREPATAAVPATTDAEYAAGLEKLVFLQTCPRSAENFIPSTGIGRFDILLEPPRLTLTVKVRFVPMGGRWDPDDLQVKLPRFQEDWLKTVSGFWTPGLFTFWSQRPGWEDLSITVNPVFRVVKPGEQEHVLIEVTNEEKNFGREHHSAVDNRRHVAHFGTNDNEPRAHGDKHTQRTSVHEAGHLLGLGDEYPDGGVVAPGAQAGHSKLAERQLGHTVPLGKTDSIMSGGERLLPQHSVTMREALEQVAIPYTEWGLQPRRPAPAAVVR